MKIRFANLSLGFAVSACAAHAQNGAQSPHSAQSPQISADLLSDTGGASMGPYLQHLVADLKQQWLPLVAQAGQPAGERKEVVIRVVIQPDGEIGLAHLEQPGVANDGLQKAAWKAVTQVAADPLPAAVAAHTLGLRLHFVTD